MSDSAQRIEPRPAAPHPRYVVVHGGARDNYELASALEQHGMLDTLVTDLFWPENAGWAKKLWQMLPAAARGLLRQRSKADLPARRVKQTMLSGLLAHVVDRLSFVPFAWKRAVRRWSDARLGLVAGRLARRRGVGLISYSYYGYHAFQAYGREAVLFQLHPHPTTMRTILERELQEHPECAPSLLQEWELALPADDLDHLVAESHSASRYLVASSFTRQSLIDNGVTPQAVQVVPYGIDLQRFHPRAEKDSNRATLQLLFVGRINQRKGLSYLLQALRLLADLNVHLTICGRVLDDLSTFEGFEQQVTIRPSVSPAELVAAYQGADLFVFPSVGEGFGQVLLEAMACGLPILATTRTAAPDLIDDGVQGFIVGPKDPQALAERIRWASDHRDALALMGRRARLQAEQFPWERFRMQIAQGLESSVFARYHAESPRRI